MRPIDADALKEFIESAYRPLCDDYHMKDYVFEQILHDIDNEPIIEAIPIDFLIKTQEEYCKRYGEVYKSVVLNLIEDWEKENG